MSRPPRSTDPDDVARDAARALSAISGTALEVVRLAYGFDIEGDSELGYVNPMTDAQIGDKLAMSRASVARIREAAQATMRAVLESGPATPGPYVGSEEGATRYSDDLYVGLPDDRRHVRRARRPDYESALAHLAADLLDDGAENGSASLRTSTFSVGPGGTRWEDADVVPHGLDLARLYIARHAPGEVETFPADVDRHVAPLVRRLSTEAIARVLAELPDPVRYRRVTFKQ